MRRRNSLIVAPFPYSNFRLCEGTMWVNSNLVAGGGVRKNAV